MATKVRQSNLDNSVITGNTELTATAAADDVLLVFDTSSSSLKKIQRSNLVLQSPTFSSISPSNANTGDGTGNHTFTITGTKFDTAPVVKFRGNDGSALISATSTTRNSATQLTVVIAKSSLPNSNEPYDVSITNTNGLAVETTSNPLNINAQPAYVTSAGTLGTVNGGANVGRIIINANDPESVGVVTYELQSGSLPAGLSLSNETSEGGIAVITGTATNPSANTTSNFVIRAVDAASNTTSRAFSITVNRVFTSTSFTSSGTFAVPSGVSSLDAVLVVAGGGGGGGDNGGGGGAGGLIFAPGHPVTPGGTVAVTVGDGGTPPGVNSPGSTGSDSVFGASPSPGTTVTLTAKGGGFGGGGNPRNAAQGGSGGGGGGHGDGPSSGQGGQATQPTQPGNSGAYGFGHDGGNANPGNSPRTSGAGGGAGAAGGAGGNYGGQGGDGKAYTIADGTSPVFYAGGGGGGTGQPNTSGSGGQGGGGGGGSPSGASGSGATQGGQGTDGKGGGGGGGSNQCPRPGGQGGKGIVIVRY